MTFFKILKKFSRNIVILFTVLLSISTFSGVVASTNVSFRMFDGALGILEMPLTKGGKIGLQKMMNKLNYSIEIEAQFGIDAPAIGVAIVGALTAAAVSLVQSFISVIAKKILGFVKGLVQSVLGLKIVEFIDKFVNILSQLNDILSTTRIAFAFKAFAAIQNDGNIKKSEDFAEDIIFSDSESANPALAFIDEDGKNTIKDAIVWLDFYNVQSALQADTYADFVNSISRGFLDIDRYDEVKEALYAVLSATQCDNDELVEALGAFGSIVEDDSACKIEREASADQLIGNREGEIKSLAIQKAKTFESAAPADCKLKNYVKYESIDFNYQNGQLAQNIIDIADQIEIVTVTPEECNVAAEGQAQIREQGVIAGQASNLVTGDDDVVSDIIGGSEGQDSLGGSGVAGDDLSGEGGGEGFFGQFVKNLIGDIWKPMEEKIETWVGEIEEFLQNVELANAGLLGVAIEVGLAVGEELVRQLEDLELQLQEDIEKIENTRDVPTEQQIEDLPLGSDPIA